MDALGSNSSLAALLGDGGAQGFVMTAYLVALPRDCTHLVLGYWPRSQAHRMGYLRKTASLELALMDALGLISSLAIHLGNGGAGGFVGMAYLVTLPRDCAHSVLGSWPRR